MYNIKDAAEMATGRGWRVMIMSFRLPHATKHRQMQTHIPPPHPVPSTHAMSPRVMSMPLPRPLSSSFDALARLHIQEEQRLRLGQCAGSINVDRQPEARTHRSSSAKKAGRMFSLKFFFRGNVRVYAYVSRAIYVEPRS